MLKSELSGENINLLGSATPTAPNLPSGSEPVRNTHFEPTARPVLAGQGLKSHVFESKKQTAPSKEKER